MTLRRVHWLVGLATLAIFLATGQYLLQVAPPGDPGNELPHFVMTATHIYVMFAGLLNLTLGMYLPPAAAGWRGKAQRLGSLGVLAAPALLVAAFFTEGSIGLGARPLTGAGVTLIFFGIGLRFAARAPVGADTRDSRNEAGAGTSAQVLP